nr:MAG TPA: hypothetical protein [Caudoviricetes sp.]
MLIVLKQIRLDDLTPCDLRILERAIGAVGLDAYYFRDIFEIEYVIGTFVTIKEVVEKYCYTDNRLERIINTFLNFEKVLFLY